MASPSLFPLLRSLNPPPNSITSEEFNIFHSIDRDLYSILIFYLCRDPAESMQVMALWLWLEREGNESRLVHKLMSIPVPFVNAVADETVKCLKCIETDNFRTDTEANDIPALRSLLKKSVGIRYFHENRITVLRGVTKIVDEVCIRAFTDILRNAFHQHNQHMNTYRVGESSTSTFGRNEMNVPVVPFGYFQSLLNAPLHLDLESEGALENEQFWMNYDPTRMVHPYDLSTQRQFVNDELGEQLSRMSLSVTGEKKEVPPDDRTIFLTFSKGYPISETEVKDFFTAKFGNIMEAIYMQEVQLPDEQVLYARVVVRSASTIDAVLGGQGKAKFTINGKHVWARKFVRKNPRSPPGPPSRAPSPPLPPAAVGVSRP